MWHTGWHFPFQLATTHGRAITVTPRLIGNFLSNSAQSKCRQLASTRGVVLRAEKEPHVEDLSWHWIYLGSPPGTHWAVSNGSRNIRRGPLQWRVTSDLEPSTLSRSTGTLWTSNWRLCNCLHPAWSFLPLFNGVSNGPFISHLIVIRCFCGALGFWSLFAGSCAWMVLWFSLQSLELSKRKGTCLERKAFEP